MVGAALVGMLLMLTAGGGGEAPVPQTPTYAVASLAELRGESGQDTGLVAVRLPGSERFVVLRPISRAEFDAAQTQAIAHQLIEWQLLAAALVAPGLDPVDVTGLPLATLRFLKAKVNEISGFPVFP